MAQSAEAQEAIEYAIKVSYGFILRLDGRASAQSPATP